MAPNYANLYVGLFEMRNVLDNTVDPSIPFHPYIKSGRRHIEWVTSTTHKVC